MTKSEYFVEASGRFMADDDPPTFCTMCGKQMDVWDRQEKFEFDHLVGYGSKYDASHIRFKLCCSCFDKLMDWMRSQCVTDPVLDDEMDWYCIRKEDIPMMKEVAGNLNAEGAKNLLEHLGWHSRKGADETHQYLQALVEAFRPISLNTTD